MKISKVLKIQFGSFFIVLTAILLFFMLTKFTTWYIAVGVLGLAVAGGYFIYKKQSLYIKKTLTENIFIVITAIAAISIIVFVIYLLLHIFMLGKDELSWSFLTTAPSEGLSEGGIFPAIMGTALLVIIMSIAGVPVGIITAIYLTEYAKDTSKIAKVIRFAVNTLAGVPAIVFGLFGLGFFIGVIGNNIDQYQYNNRLDKMKELFASEQSVFAGDGTATVEEIRNLLKEADAEYWDRQIDLTLAMGDQFSETAEIKEATALQYFEGKNRPKWGQPALIWAALTMALLTLPVVIVSVEEAIKTVPRDLREASLALGATKFTTIRKVVLPGSITGILTGGILAVSRGAGEVAPILFTGAAYFLTDLPNSLSSQFMELGYHIYVLSTQSPNVELSKPLQYATTLVLLILTFTLNFTAIFIRSRVRAKLSKMSN